MRSSIRCSSLRSILLLSSLIFSATAGAMPKEAEPLAAAELSRWSRVKSDLNRRLVENHIRIAPPAEKETPMDAQKELETVFSVKHRPEEALKVLITLPDPANLTSEGARCLRVKVDQFLSALAEPLSAEDGSWQVKVSSVDGDRLGAALKKLGASGEKSGSLEGKSVFHYRPFFEGASSQTAVGSWCWQVSQLQRIYEAQAHSCRRPAQGPSEVLVLAEAALRSDVGDRMLQALFQLYSARAAETAWSLGFGKKAAKSSPKDQTRYRQVALNHYAALSEVSEELRDHAQQKIKALKAGEDTRSRAFFSACAK